MEISLKYFNIIYSGSVNFTFKLNLLCFYLLCLFAPLSFSFSAISSILTLFCNAGESVHQNQSGVYSFSISPASYVQWWSHLVYLLP